MSYPQFGVTAARKVIHRLRTISRKLKLKTQCLCGFSEFSGQPNNFSQDRTFSRKCDFLTSNLRTLDKHWTNWQNFNKIKPNNFSQVQNNFSQV